MRSITIALALSILTVAPIADAKQDKEQGAVTAKIRHLATGTTSGFHERVTAVAGDAVAWKGMWDRHTANVTPKPPLPEVDFKNEMVIGVFDGDKPTGGYTVSVKQVILTPKSVKVKVASSSPPPGSMTSQMVTQPFDIIAAPKSSAPVQRQDAGSK